MAPSRLISKWVGAVTATGPERSSPLNVYVWGKLADPTFAEKLVS